MPRNANTVVPIEQLSPEDRKKEPGHSQDHWYALAGAYSGGLTVLDVGAGTGSGLTVLRAMGAKEVLGVDPLPVGPDVLPINVKLFRDASLDIVTCFDVIEHVEDDVGLLADLLRICRYTAFISTPNWNVWKCANKYHVREYTPAELEALLQGQQYVCWTSGANRVTEPVKPCALADALASYCIAVRGPGCTDEQWLNLQSGAAAAAAEVPRHISRYSKWSEEWNSEAKLVYAAEPSPVAGYVALASWLNQLVQHAEASIVSEGRNPVMDCLRYGLATAQEQLKIIEWAHSVIRGDR